MAELIVGGVWLLAFLVLAMAVIAAIPWPRAFRGVDWAAEQDLYDTWWTEHAGERADDDQA